MDQAKSKNSSLTNVIAYALIGCIAFVVMKFEFPIMPGVAFLKFDFQMSLLQLECLFLALYRELLLL